MNIVHDMGLTVSHTSVSNKRKHLIKKQEQVIDRVVKSNVRIVEQSHKHQPAATESLLNIEKFNQFVNAYQNVESGTETFLNYTYRPNDGRSSIKIVQNMLNMKKCPTLI